MPATWRWARFDEVARVASNLVDPKDYPDAPHIAPNHIKSETGQLLQWTSIAKDGVTSAKHRFFGGQVLYSKIRPYLAKVIVADFDGLCSADMYPIESELQPHYLKWWMLTREFTRRAAGEQARTVLPKINVRALAALPIPIPLIGEQRRIVEILEDHLSRLDAALLDVSAAVASLGALRGRLRDRALDEAEAAGAPVSLGNLVKPGRKLAYGVLVPGPHVEEGVPLIRVGDLRGGVVRQTELKRIAPEISCKFPRTLLEGGEVLLSLVGTIGRTGVAPLELAKANVARAVGVLPLRDGVDARFVSLLLEAPRTNRALNGLAHEVARKTLNIEDVKSFKVPMPAPHEQRRIVVSADEALSAVRRLEATSTATSFRASRLRRALLDAAFSGRLM